MGASAAELACGKDGNQSVWLITDPFISYTESLTRYFKESFEGQGGKIVAEDTVVHEKADTASLLAKWKAFGTKPDCIWVSGYPDTLGPIIKEFRASGIDVPIYGGDVYEDPELWEVWGKEYSDNITWAGHCYISEEAVPTIADYQELYKAKYNEDLDAPWSMAGWDVIMVLAEAMKETNSFDGATVAKYMEENTFPVLTGGPDGMTWSSAEEGHEPDKAACMVKLEKGEPIFLGWKKPDVLPKP
jgi:branched-chain amino acid transport system substrate-binding protein